MPELLALLLLAAAPDCRRYEDPHHVCAPTFAGCACAAVTRAETPTPRD